MFFLPGSKGGYIFSYRHNQLSLAKAVSAPQVKRAIYINDYLYLIGEKDITVIDETDWQTTNQFDF